MKFKINQEFSKPSWFNPLKIDLQTIQDALIEAKPYISGLILDVGCGTKPWFAILAENEKQYIGLDSNVLKQDEIEVYVDVCGNAEELPFKSKLFDTVVSFQLLEHTMEPDLVIREMSRVLKEGGHLVLTAPQTWCIHQAPYDYFRFTKFGLSYLAERNGFEVITIRPRGGFMAMCGQIFAYTLNNVVESMVNKLIPKSRAALIPLRGACALISVMFFAIDRALHKMIPGKLCGDTLGYILIAKKE